MTWPWLGSLIGISEVLRVGLPQPRPLNDRPVRRMSRSAFAKSLKHRHGHLGQHLAKVLEGRDSARPHSATPRNAVELAAEMFVQFPAKILLRNAHPLVPAVPRDEHTDPGLFDLVQAAEQFAVRVRQSDPRIDEAQARRRYPVVASSQPSRLERPDGELAVEALRGEVRRVVGDGLGVVRLIWAPGMRCLTVIIAHPAGWER